MSYTIDQLPSYTLWQLNEVALNLKKLLSEEVIFDHAYTYFTQKHPWTRTLLIPFTDHYKIKEANARGGVKAYISHLEHRKEQQQETQDTHFIKRSGLETTSLFPWAILFVEIPCLWAVDLPHQFFFSQVRPNEYRLIRYHRPGQELP